MSMVELSALLHKKMTPDSRNTCGEFKRRFKTYCQMKMNIKMTEKCNLFLVTNLFNTNN